MRLHCRVIVSLIALIGACEKREPNSSGGDTAALLAGETWDVNDISVLYPIRDIRKKSATRGLPPLNEGLMSQAQFDKTLEFFRKDFKLDFASGGQAVSMNSMAKWGVVGFRIHDCFKVKVADPCTPQVNIVAQSVLEGEAMTTDFAIHLLYQPSASSLELLKDMIKIRKQYAKSENTNLTIGKPVGIHPILKAEGLDSPFAKALTEEFLHKHLNTSNLKTIAVSFVEPNRLQPWIFFKFDAKNPIVAKNNSIFMFDPGTSVNDCGVQKGRLVCRRDLETGAIVDSEEKQEANPRGQTPKATTASGRPYLDDFLTIAQTAPDGRVQSTLKAQLPMWESVFNRIENPTMIAPEETNCVSCHRTDTDRRRFKDILPMNEKTGPNAFLAKANSGCTPGNGVDSSKGVKTFNVRLFGYLHSDPIIGKRVENETISVCESLKKNLK